MAIDIETIDHGLVARLLGSHYPVYFNGKTARFVCRGILEKPEFLDDHKYTITKEYITAMDLYTLESELRDKLEKAGYIMCLEDSMDGRRYKCPNIFRVPKEAEGHEYKLQPSKGEFIDPETMRIINQRRAIR